MQYYTIPPFAHLDFDLEAHHYLTVAQWVEQKEDLFTFYKKRIGEGAKVILDNGVHEFREPYPVEKYLDMAKELGVETIVAPDKWGEADWTVNLVLDFMDVLSKEDKSRFKIMGVPHGETLIDFVDCYYKLQLYCDIIGLAKDEWRDESGYIRPFMTWKLDWAINKPKFHLLGLNHTKELWLCNPETTVSFDTSMPYKAAMMHVLLMGENNEEDITVQGKYQVDRVMSETELKYAGANLEILRLGSQKTKLQYWR